MKGIEAWFWLRAAAPADRAGWPAELGWYAGWRKGGNDLLVVSDASVRAVKLDSTVSVPAAVTFSMSVTEMLMVLARPSSG